MHSASFFAGEATLENVFSGPCRKEGNQEELGTEGKPWFPCGLVLVHWHGITSSVVRKLASRLVDN